MSSTKARNDPNGNGTASPVTNDGQHAGYLTTDEFAKAVGVKAETVRRWWRDGRLRPAGKTPTGHRRFHPRQVAEVLGVESPPSETRAASAGPVTQALAMQIRNDMLREMRQCRAG